MAAPTPTVPTWTPPAELAGEMTNVEALLAQYTAKITDLKAKIGANNKAEADKAASEAKDLMSRLIEAQRAVHSRLTGNPLLSACALAATAAASGFDTLACNLGFKRRGGRRRTGCQLTNPRTGYNINYGGPTHAKLCAQGTPDLDCANAFK